MGGSIDWTIGSGQKHGPAEDASLQGEVKRIKTSQGPATLLGTPSGVLQYPSVIAVSRQHG